jgi:stage V sporulation protein K
MSLIESFKDQGWDTIRQTLEALAADSKVFSARIQSELSFMGGHEQYVYMQGDETVFLLRDEHRSGIPVLADEEPYMDRPPLYRTQGPCWTSPVYLLQLLCHAYKEVMRKTGREAGKVHGVFLTNTYIANKEDMEDIWEWLGVTVFDGVGMHGEIATAFNGLDKEREQLEHFFAYSNLATWTLDPEYDHVMENCPPYLCQCADAEDDCSPEDTDDDDIDGCTPDGRDEDDEDVDSLPDDSHDDEEEEVETVRQHLRDGNTHAPLPDDLKEAFTFTSFEEPCWENAEEEEIPDHVDEDCEEERGMGEDVERQVHTISPVPLQGVEVFEPVDNTVRLFGTLVGMYDIYRYFVYLHVYGAARRRRREEGGKTYRYRLPKHRIFCGNPGTGKTTAGRLYANSLHDLGCISKGHVVVVSGKALAGMMAEEGAYLDKVLGMAQGGVLMIKEAYTLSAPCKDDPDTSVLDLLMRAMAGEKGKDLAVVLTGSEDQIDELYGLNLGMASKFPRDYNHHFRDFSPKVLCMIARKKAEEDGYTLTPEAWAKLEGIIAEAHASRNPSTFGNAWFVGGLLEEAYRRHAASCRDSHGDVQAAPRLIDANDIQ